MVAAGRKPGSSGEAYEKRVILSEPSPLTMRAPSAEKATLNTQPPRAISRSLAPVAASQTVTFFEVSPLTMPQASCVRQACTCARRPS